MLVKLSQPNISSYDVGFRNELILATSGCISLGVNISQIMIATQPETHIHSIPTHIHTQTNRDTQSKSHSDI